LARTTTPVVAPRCDVLRTYSGRIDHCFDWRLLHGLAAHSGSPPLLRANSLIKRQGKEMNEKIHSTSSRLRIENATIGYDKTVISEDISVEIPHNSFTAIIGPNGCGKSTLLRALARVLVPVKGRVMLDDQNISKYKP